MAQRSHVPQFGNWDNEDNVPYTAYFDKARKGRTAPGGKMINPNDPEENSETLSDHSSLADKGKPEGPGPARPAPLERERSKEEGELRQYANSPANNLGNARRGSSDGSGQRQGAARGGGVGPGDARGRGPRHSLGSEQSIEKSPLHRNARAAGRDSQSWEGRGSQEASHGTPSRSRLRPRGDETPDHGAAVPKFGEWDETNPASADGFTHIFNKVREERQIGAGRVGTPEPSYPRKPAQDEGAKGCCFWFKK